jgi:hypothetical protein
MLRSAIFSVPFAPQVEGTLLDVLIRDEADRDAISSQLMRYRDENGQGWADIIDLLTMYLDARRWVIRIGRTKGMDRRALDHPDFGNAYGEATKRVLEVSSSSPPCTSDEYRMRYPLA